MRSVLLGLTAAALLSAPAFAQPKAGDRTMTPDQVLAELGSGVSDEELARAVAAASAFPLGTAENPIRVGGPEGARAYMDRLRCADGSRPKIGQRAPAGVGAFGTIVDLYPLDCGLAAPGKRDLVTDIYHAEHQEDRAPAGFAIAPR